MFTFCRPVSSKKRFLPHRKLTAEFTFTLFESASRLETADWNAVRPEGQVFFDPLYLGILEEAEHSRVECRYAIVYRRAKPCGIVYFQIVDFHAGIFGDLISGQVDTLRSKRMGLFEKYVDRNRGEVLMRLFTCGNNLVSGPYGFMHNALVSETKFNELLLAIIDVVAKEEKLRGTISAVLLKDFEKPLKPATLFDDESYTRFAVDPDLVVEIPSGVKTLADYTGLFSKKYRNRAKAIFRRLDGVSTKYLTAADMVREGKQVQMLYGNVFERARFRLIKLPAEYFSNVKRAYPKQFIVKGFFRDGKMIAFLSALVMPGDLLEAHYIGIDYEYNKEHDLYQNILYTLIEEAILHKRRRVNLGRTAAEIKTTVGAQPVDLICYIKPQNAISRMLQRPFITFLQPAEWTPRNPFRDDSAE
jgi:hypothetical protein